MATRAQEAAFLPCLLERWERHLGPENDSTDGTFRVIGIGWSEVRRDVIRNLEWLLNTESPTWSTDPRSGDRIPFSDAVANSVVGFGVPPYSGRTQSQLDPVEMARQLRSKIVAFEPRIEESTLEVFPPEDRPAAFNTLTIIVRGHLRSDPLTAFELKTQIDMEAGKAQVVD